MVKTLLAYAALLTPIAASAQFQGSDVPVHVKFLPCDSSPRILVQFADPSKNIWYPANNGENSKAFLAIALSAKASGSAMYYFGFGSETALTSYCIAASAREVTLFGIN